MILTSKEIKEPAMSHITFTKDEALSIAREFIEDDFSLLCGGFFHPKRIALALDFQRHSVFDDNGDAITHYLLEDVVAAVYDFCKTGVWQGGDFEEYEMIFKDFMALEFPEGVGGVVSNNRKELAVLASVLEARQSISPLEGTTTFPDTHVYLSDIAYMGDLTEETVRVATYAEGDKKLNAESGGRVAVEEAIRWLKSKQRYFPSRYEYKQDYNPKSLLEDVFDLSRWLKASISSVKLDSHGLVQLLGLTGIDREQLFALLNSPFRKGKIDLTFPWFHSAIALKLGNLFKVNPQWVTKSILNIAHQHTVAKALAELGTHQERTATTGVDVNSINPDTSLSPKLAKEIVGSCLERNPLQKKPNAKMDGYVLKDGTSITHEHSLKNQYLWIPQKKYVPEMDAFESTLYPASDLNKEGNYGRHSGLKKYPDLVEADLVRLQPKTAGELIALIEMIS